MKWEYSPFVAHREMLALAFCERNELTRHYLRVKYDLVLPVAEIRATRVEFEEQIDHDGLRDARADRAAADPEISAGLQ